MKTMSHPTKGFLQALATTDPENAPGLTKTHDDKSTKADAEHGDDQLRCGEAVDFCRKRGLTPTPTPTLTPPITPTPTPTPPKQNIQSNDNTNDDDTENVVDLLETQPSQPPFSPVNREGATPTLEQIESESGAGSSIVKVPTVLAYAAVPMSDPHAVLMGHTSGLTSGSTSSSTSGFTQTSSGISEPAKTLDIAPVAFVTTNQASDLLTSDMINKYTASVAMAIGGNPAEMQFLTDSQVSAFNALKSASARQLDTVIPLPAPPSRPADFGRWQQQQMVICDCAEKKNMIMAFQLKLTAKPDPQCNKCLDRMQDLLSDASKQKLVEQRKLNEQQHQPDEDSDSDTDTDSDDDEEKQEQKLQVFDKFVRTVHECIIELCTHGYVLCNGGTRRWPQHFKFIGAPQGFKNSKVRQKGLKDHRVDKLFDRLVMCLQPWDDAKQIEKAVNSLKKIQSEQSKKKRKAVSKLDQKAASKRQKLTAKVAKVFAVSDDEFQNTLYGMMRRIEKKNKDSNITPSQSWELFCKHLEVFDGKTVSV